LEKKKGKGGRERTDTNANWLAISTMQEKGGGRRGGRFQIIQHFELFNVWRGKKGGGEKGQECSSGDSSPFASICMEKQGASFARRGKKGEDEIRLEQRFPPHGERSKNNNVLG